MSFPSNLALMNMPRTITVNDKMQRNYSYELVVGVGDFPSEFAPALTPPKMLELGVFEGKYLNDCTDEFPETWFENAKISEKPSIENNCFRIKSRQPLSVWKEKGWIVEPDPRGWFQWYCRYYIGRRIAGVDAFQIKRWRAFTRHKAQVEKNCDFMDLDCRSRQRQALLQWAYDPFF